MGVMTASDSFVDFLKDSLSGLGPVNVRRMFGGAGVYADGVMFGLVTQDTLYLKADVQSQRAFEAEGLQPFKYESRGRVIAVSYWRIPERLLDDPDEMVIWARRALLAARIAAAEGRPKRASRAKPRRKKRAARRPASARPRNAQDVEAGYSLATLTGRFTGLRRKAGTLSAKPERAGCCCCSCGGCCRGRSGRACAA